MNSHFVNMIVMAVSRQTGVKSTSPYQQAKQAYGLRIGLYSTLRSLLFIITGVVSAGFGLNSFLLPNHFVDGGATGISLLLTDITNWSLPTLLVLVNLPFMIMAFYVIGKGFAMRTMLAIALLALAVTFVPYPRDITNDPLLVAVFGGFFLGAGIGLSVRGGAVIDGTEVLAISISRHTSLTIGDVILLLNIIIFSFAAYLLSIETALYSLLTYFAASRTVDFVIEGIEEYTGVTIISPKSKALHEMITHRMGRGVTVYQGRGGSGKAGIVQGEQAILYTVITRLEVSKLQTEIDKIDPYAFVVMSSVKDTRGGMIKKRPLKH